MDRPVIVVVAVHRRRPKSMGDHCSGGVCLSNPNHTWASWALFGYLVFQFEICIHSLATDVKNHYVQASSGYCNNRYFHGDGYPSASIVCSTLQQWQWLACPLFDFFPSTTWRSSSATVTFYQSLQYGFRRVLCINRNISSCDVSGTYVWPVGGHSHLSCMESVSSILPYGKWKISIFLRFLTTTESSSDSDPGLTIVACHDTASALKFSNKIGLAFQKLPIVICDRPTIKDRKIVFGPPML